MKSIPIAMSAGLMLGLGLALTSSADAKRAPEITYLWPRGGQVLDQRPTYFRMCFEPVDERDVHIDGRLSFEMTTPETCQGRGELSVASPRASASPTRKPNNGLTARENNSRPDVLLLALLTIGAAAAASVVGLFGYVLRNRIGFWLHRPPDRDGDTNEGHH